MRNQIKTNIGTGRCLLTGAAILLLMVMSCDNATSPNQDLSNSYDIPVAMHSGDKIHSTIDELPVYTVEGFYFLPPLVKSSEFSGTFDAGVSPVVKICETTACEDFHVSFDTEGEGSERVRLSDDDEHYIVNWNTNHTGTNAGQTYRLRVLVGDVVLGHANIQMAKNGREARNVNTDEAIGLVDGRTLPVKFRIETGIVGSIVVEPAEATIQTGETQQFTATLFDLHGEPVDGEVVSWSSDDEDLAEVDGDGLATGKSEGEAVINAATGPAIGSAKLTVTAGTETGFFLAENGITIRCPDAQPEDKGFVGDIEYEAVDRALLIQRRDEGADLTRLCTTPVMDMSRMFQGMDIFNQDIGGWDTGNVTDMSDMFFRTDSFNQYIGEWDTGNVTNMRGMFSNATSFNHDIGNWDTGNVTNMAAMFSSAISFNQDLNGWDIKNVTDMRNMFNGASSFNGVIGDWDTSNVTNMNGMFIIASAFNQDISGWVTGKVTNMNRMFDRASSFNQDISGWDTKRMTIIGSMFQLAISFNQDIGDWDTGNVTNMAAMFNQAGSFNQDLSGWDTKRVTIMSSMFQLAISFNQDIGGWDTGNVFSMTNMFNGATSFNKDIGDWDTGNVTNMDRMFQSASSFNQNLSGWCVSEILEKPINFDSGATSWTLTDSRPKWGFRPE